MMRVEDRILGGDRVVFLRKGGEGVRNRFVSSSSLGERVRVVFCAFVLLFVRLGIGFNLYTIEEENVT